MELVLRSNNRIKLEKVIAFAKKLNVSVEEKRPETATSSVQEREALLNRVLGFKAGSDSSFGDALEWQQANREDRQLPL